MNRTRRRLPQFLGLELSEVDALEWSGTAEEPALGCRHEESRVHLALDQRQRADEIGELEATEATRIAPRRFRRRTFSASR